MRLRLAAAIACSLPCACGFAPVGSASHMPPVAAVAPEALLPRRQSRANGAAIARAPPASLLPSLARLQPSRSSRLAMKDEDEDTPLDMIFDAWNLIINTAGSIVFAGLVLNMCGFGYHITVVPPSVVVKPLAEMRRDSALKRFFAKAHDPDLFGQFGSESLAAKP